MVALVVALMIIGEHFPFSNFPMYSNFGTDADVMFVTDQNNEPVYMKPLFNTSSSSAKKRYKKELSTICKKGGHDISEATTEERNEAGSNVLKSLMDDIDHNQLPPHITELRLQLRTFEFDREADKVVEHEPELLASLPLNSKSGTTNTTGN